MIVSVELEGRSRKVMGAVWQLEWVKRAVIASEKVRRMEEG